MKLGEYGVLPRTKRPNGNRATLWHMAPEGFRGEMELKSDVWSFGNSLLEMIGIVPYYNWHGMDITVAFNDNLPPFDKSDIASPEFLEFLDRFFAKYSKKRWSVNQLMEVNECRESDK